MKLTEFSLKRPVTVTMLFVCISVIGVISSQRLPLESLPDIEFPGLFVTVPYRNSTPEEVERRITRPVEEALATLPGIKSMNSESRDNGAGVFLEFDWGQDLAAKGVEARDKLDSIRDQLPSDIQRVLVQKFSAGDEPMLVLRISAERELSNAYDMLERNLKRRLERIEGVSRVELYGVLQKQVRIELAAARVASHGVDLRALAETLRKANFAISAGDLVEGGTRYYVKPEGRFTRLEDIGAMMIRADGLRLSDIADVTYSDPVQTEGRHLNERFAVGLNVFKETGANLVAVSDRAKAEIGQIATLPEMAGIKIIQFNDAADDVRSSLAELIEAGIIGALFSIAVLWVFLRDWKMTLIVTLSVPLSLLMTLAAMFFMNYSINVLTLMGLMLSVGMLVDNSVVVTESIFKERAQNPDAVAATLTGVSKVGLAVSLGTLTTAIVFLPNIFGVQNEITVFLSHVAVTICVSLGASLLVALTLIPQLTTRLKQGAGAGSRWMIPVAERYARVLEWTLRHRGKTALFILLILGSSALPIALDGVKAEMFSDSTSKRLFMDYNLNGVYQLDKVEDNVKTVEKWLIARKAELDIESVYSYYTLDRALTMIYLVEDPELRTKTSEEVKETIRKGLPKLAIGEPSFDQNRGGSEKLSVQVYGDSSERLRPIGSDVARVLKGVEGLADVRVNAGATDWEVRVRVDRDRARQHGLSSQQVAEIVAGAMRGTELRPFRSASGEVDMVLQFRRADRLDLDALLSLPIIAPSGERVTLGTVAELSIGDVPSLVRREDRRTSLAIDFATKEGVTADDAKKRVEQVLNQMEFPPGYGWAYGRAFEQEEESMQIMMVNMLLALACIYIVMAALFESVLAPTAIITGIVFSFIGVLWFFYLTGTVFTFMAMIGMLVLMGVVVNNGIVLIDHVHQLREAGLDRERALVQGSRDRLRPILMTAATTVLGMIPLAISETAIGGDGPPYFPMARAVIGGLTFATIVSLLVLPTLYLAIEDLGNWGTRAMRRARSAPLAATGEGEAVALDA